MLRFLRSGFGITAFGLKVFKWSEKAGMVGQRSIRALILQQWRCLNFLTPSIVDFTPGPYSY